MTPAPAPFTCPNCGPLDEVRWTEDVPISHTVFVDDAGRVIGRSWTREVWDEDTTNGWYACPACVVPVAVRSGLSPEPEDWE